MSSEAPVERNESCVYKRDSRAQGHTGKAITTGACSYTPGNDDHDGAGISMGPVGVILFFPCRPVVCWADRGTRFSYHPTSRPPTISPFCLMTSRGIKRRHRKAHHNITKAGQIR